MSNLGDGSAGGQAACAGRQRAVAETWPVEARALLAMVVLAMATGLLLDLPRFGLVVK